MGDGGCVPEGLVGSLGIGAVLEGAQGRLQGWQVEFPVVALPELAPDGAVEPFDPAVELGRPRGQDGAGHAFCLTGGLERGQEFGPAIDLDRLNGHRHPGDEVREKGGRRAGSGVGPHAEHRDATDDIDGRELAAFHARQGAQMHRVELDHRTGLGRLAFVLRHPHGIGAGGSRLPDSHPMRLDEQLAATQRGQDATNRRDRDRRPLLGSEVMELGLAGAGLRRA